MINELPYGELKNVKAAVKISYKRKRSAKVNYYVRPAGDCYNKPRKVTASTPDEFIRKIIACVRKYYHPIWYYIINGKVIGSNNKENAQKEYIRAIQ